MEDLRMKPARAPLAVRRAAAAAAPALFAPLAAPPAAAPTATPLQDLKPQAWQSAPPRARNLFAAGGRLFFSGGEDGEPAVADASGTGSTLLADLCPECGSSPEYLGSLGGTVLFVANPGGSGATASGL